MRKKGDVFIIYVPSYGWYTGGDDYTDMLEEAWSTPDRGVANSTAELVGGTVYALHLSYSAGSADYVSHTNGKSRFA